MKISSLIQVSVILVALLATGMLINHETKWQVSPKIHVAFQTWLLKHGKIYASPQEFLHRLSIFERALLEVEQHNASGETWTMGLNFMSDLTVEEAKAKYFGKRPSSLHQDIEVDNSLLTKKSERNAIDWVALGAVSPVKDQKDCGSCWAFSVVGALESLNMIKNKPSQFALYSEQQLVDCSTKYGNEGCNGGEESNAYKYIKDNGITTESDYPYTARDGNCKTKVGVLKVSGYKIVPHKSSPALDNACDSQPVNVGIDAEAIMKYSGGVFSDKKCGSKLDHAVLLVGYDDKTWKVKNSWSTSWGDKGFIYFDKSAVSDKNGGICGILLDSIFPFF